MREPRLSRALMRLFAPASERDDVLADLREEWSTRASRDGESAARDWYRRQVRLSLAPLLRRRTSLSARGLRAAWAHRAQTFTGFSKDVSESWRAMARGRGFAALVIATLALGIGVNTAIFTVVDALLFKALPYADGERLVRVAEWPRTGGNYTMSPAAFLDWRARARTISMFEARLVSATGLLESGEAERVNAAAVTNGYFTMLGVEPALGRTFAPPDDAPGEPCRMVLSHRLWERRFGAGRDAVGRSARLSDGACTIIGVLPADSPFDRSSVDLYVPLTFTPKQARDHGRTLTVLARLAPGVTIDQARAELTTIAATFNAARGPAGAAWTVALTPLRDVVLRPDTRRLAWTLFGAVGLVLIVTCANVASLSLSRAIDRARELMLRTALGASRWRVFRLLMVESLMLALTGAVAALLIGSLTLRLFLGLVPPGTLPAEAAAVLDWRSLIYTGGLAVAAALLFGTVPAWHGASGSPAGALASGGRSASQSRRAGRFHKTLLVVEVAMAMVLVTTASLLVVSFTRLSGVDPGFGSSAVMTTQVTLPAARYGDNTAMATFFERLLDEIRRQPKVEQAGAVTSLPLNGWLFGTRFDVEGIPSDPARPPSAHIQHTTPGYLETLAVPLVAGRAFAATDRAGAPLVAIVNRTFVRRYIGDQPAVGRRVKLGIETADGAADQTWVIIGVISDVKTGSLGDADLATPEIYVPLAQSPMPALFVAVRSAPGASGDAATALRNGVRALDPDLPLASIVSMDERIGLSVRTQRFRMSMIAAFAVLAGVLANLGVYAVRSRAVRARRRELGVRAALGANRRQLLTLLVGQGLRTVLIGLGIGLAASIWTSRFVRQWLFATDATDPMVLVAATVTLGGMALLASWVPARRAARVDPAITLRID